MRGPTGQMRNTVFEEPAERSQCPLPSKPGRASAAVRGRSGGRSKVKGATVNTQWISGDLWTVHYSSSSFFLYILSGFSSGWSLALSLGWLSQSNGFLIWLISAELLTGNFVSTWLAHCCLAASLGQSGSRNYCRSIWYGFPSPKNRCPGGGLLNCAQQPGKAGWESLLEIYGLLLAEVPNPQSQHLCSFS